MKLKLKALLSAVLIGYALSGAYPIFAGTIDTLNIPDTLPDTVIVPDTLSPPDTVVVDTVVKDTSVRSPLVTPRSTSTDSVVRRDTIKPRIGRDNLPGSFEIGRSYRYSRDELYATGALTVTDILAKVQGLTTYQTGWIPSPQVVAYNGDITRLRVFYDGIEIDDLEPRNGGAFDLRNIQLWSLEEIVIRRGANDLRVDIRSWEYNRTIPYTRVDVLTGDLNTNLYHGFFGKRFTNGAALQFAGEQYGVTDPRVGGGGDQLSLFGRYGIAKELWSVDATVLRTRTTRVTTQRLAGGSALPNYKASNTVAYLRGVIGREDDGPFAQFIASSQSLRENSSHINLSDASRFGFPPDTVDSATSAAQYIATVGFTRWGVNIKLNNRYRRFLGRGFNAISAELGYAHRYGGVAFMAEKDGWSGLSQVEIGAKVEPFNRISVAGYIGQRSADSDRTILTGSQSARVEAGVRVYGDAWLSAGFVTRDTSLILPPTVYDSSFTAVSVGRTTGIMYGLRGPLSHGFSIDAGTTIWNTASPYTPKYQFRGELLFATQWLSKFPKGNFGFQIAPSVEQRGRVLFPASSGSMEAHASRIYSIRAELRILRGIVSYQYRNLTLAVYEQVPGYLMPRRANIFGMRWFFFD